MSQATQKFHGGKYVSEVAWLMVNPQKNLDARIPISRPDRLMFRHKEMDRMTEIPELSKDECQKIASEMFVGITAGTGAAIRQKFGPGAEDEFGTMAAQGCAMNLESMGANTPLNYVLHYAAMSKNLFGRDVEVDCDVASAILNTKMCATLKIAMELGKMGMPVSREDYCRGCINGYHEKVAANIGLKLDAAFMEHGCKMTIRK